MSITQHDIDSFHQFASQQLPLCGTGADLEELLKRWQQRREEEETVASIQRGIADVEAGRVATLAEVDDGIRAKLGFPARP
jgi:hypothetical protein